MAATPIFDLRTYRPDEGLPGCESTVHPVILAAPVQCMRAAGHQQKDGSRHRWWHDGPNLVVLMHWTDSYGQDAEARAAAPGNAAGAPAPDDAAEDESEPESA